MIILPRRVTCAYYSENWPHSPKFSVRQENGRKLEEHLTDYCFKRPN